MAIATQSLLALTANDLMRREIITIPQNTSLRDAARLLFENQITGAPVVDTDGRCIGVLSASDFVHWTADGANGMDDLPHPTCPYQVKGRLLTGEEAVICTLSDGSCPLQKPRPTTGGRHTYVCQQPSGVVTDWQQMVKNLPISAVCRYMTSDVVTVGPDTSLSKLARMMIDAHIHRVIVVDEHHKPVGIVTSTDLLAALAHAEGQA